MLRRRVSAETAAVLSLFLEDTTKWYYGLDAVEKTGIAPGTLYPILLRLEKAGVLVSECENAGKRRRFYTLTSEGTDAAREAVARWREASRRPHRLARLRHSRRREASLD